MPIRTSCPFPVITSSGIYQIKNKETGAVYIGSAINFYLRWRRHLSELRGQYHYNTHLQRAWNLYGETAFLWEVLEETPKEEATLLSREQVYLDSVFNKGGLTYNCCRIAGSNRGVKRSDETRRRMSEARRGRSKGDPKKPKEKRGRFGNLSTKGKVCAIDPSGKNIMVYPDDPRLESGELTRGRAKTASPAQTLKLEQLKEFVLLHNRLPNRRATDESELRLYRFIYWANKIRKGPVFDWLQTLPEVVTASRRSALVRFETELKPFVEQHGRLPRSRGPEMSLAIFLRSHINPEFEGYSPEMAEWFSQFGQRSEKRWMNRDGVQAVVLPGMIESYLEQGWELGKRDPGNQTRRSKKFNLLKEFVRAHNRLPSLKSENFEERTLKQFMRYSISINDTVVIDWLDGLTFWGPGKTRLENELKPFVRQHGRLPDRSVGERPLRMFILDSVNPRSSRFSQEVADWYETLPMKKYQKRASSATK